jgi:coenzyme F420-reducing hydrogenase delta subunit
MAAKFRERDKRSIIKAEIKFTCYIARYTPLDYEGTKYLAYHEFIEIIRRT